MCILCIHHISFVLDLYLFMLIMLFGNDCIFARNYLYASCGINKSFVNRPLYFGQLRTYLVTFYRVLQDIIGYILCKFQ